MHPDLLQILTNQDQPIDNEKLIAYLTGKLNAVESREMEAQLAASGLEEDALEGLLLVKDKKKLPDYQQHLQLFLKANLKQDKRKPRKKLDISWIWLAAATGGIILLAILVWYFIHYLYNQ